MTDPLILLYSPFPSIEAAREVARILLEERLVACCNLLPGMESHYRWEGRLTSATETVLLAKTPAAVATQAAAKLGELHPYAIPAILQLPVEVNAGFAQWAATETAAK